MPKVSMEVPVSENVTGIGRNPTVSIFRRAWNFLRDQLVQDVRAEDAACEFDCHVDQCTVGEWESCENRLQTSARLLKHAKPAESRPAD